MPRVKVEVRPVASRRDSCASSSCRGASIVTSRTGSPRSCRSGGASWIATRTPSSSTRRPSYSWPGATASRWAAQRPGRPRLNEFQGNDWGLFGFFEAENDPEAAERCSTPPRGWLAERGQGPDGRADGLHHQRRVRAAGGGLRTQADDPPALASALLPELLEGGARKAMDLYMWELRLDKVEDKGGFHPLIHATAKKVREEHGVTIRNMRKRTRGQLSRFLEVYNAGLGANWGFVPLERDRGSLHCRASWATAIAPPARPPDREKPTATRVGSGRPSVRVARLPLRADRRRRREAVRRYVEELRRRARFKVRGMGTVVACVRVAQHGPAILLSGHLEGTVPRSSSTASPTTRAALRICGGGHRRDPRARDPARPVCELPVPDGSGSRSTS